MKRWIGLYLIAALAVLQTGCGSKQRPWDSLTDCERDNTELSMQVKDLQAKNKQLAANLKASLGLEKGIQLETLNTLAKIRIGKRTGFYDKDNDGIQETLVVYVEPLDNQQDYIKAIGNCRVDLWDLNQPADKVRTLSFEFDPDYLNENWGGTIFRSYYRLIDQSKALKDYLSKHHPEELTIKVSFSDYIGRKIVTDQKVISYE